MPSPDQIADLYTGDAIYKPPSEEDYQARKRKFQSIADELQRSQVSAGRMLEIGCNAGFAMDAFKERGWRVDGCEQNVATAEYARRRLGCRVVHSLADLDKNERFDLILLSHVLEHIVEPVPFLKEVAARLTAQGLVYILVPNYGSLFVRHLYRNSWRACLPFQHVWYFVPASLRKLLGMCGFRLARIKTDGLMQFRGRNPVVTCIKFPLALLQRLIPLQGDELVTVFERAGSEIDAFPAKSV